MKITDKVKSSILTWASHYKYSKECAQNEIAFLESFVPDKHERIIQFDMQDFYPDIPINAIITLHNDFDDIWD